MNRRSLLSAAGIGAITLAGYIGHSTVGPIYPRKYEECPRTVVEMSELPGSARAEAMNALEDNGYESYGRLTLEEVLDVDRSYVQYDGNYYTVAVERTGNRHRVKLSESPPPEAEPVELQNGLDEAVTIDVTVSRDDSTFLKETVELGADDSDREVVQLGPDADWRYGRYHLSVEGDEVDPAQRTFRIYEFLDPIELVLGDGVVRQPTDLETFKCEWKFDGAVYQRHG